MKKNMIKKKQTKKEKKIVNGSTEFCLFCITVDDIAVIYVTTHKSAGGLICRIRLHAKYGIF